MGKKSKARRINAPRRKDEPADWQEAHSPTVLFTARGDVRHDLKTHQPKMEVLGIARRRKDDAELVMDLSNEQIQAAEELREAYFMIVGAVALKGASYEQRVDQQRGSPIGPAPEFDKTTHHQAWALACRHIGVDVDAVHAVICEGYGCRSVDRARAMRNGWAAEQVRRGLNQWQPARPKRSRSSRPPMAAQVAY